MWVFSCQEVSEMIPVLIGCMAFGYFHTSFVRGYRYFLYKADSGKYPLPRWLPIAEGTWIVMLPTVILIDVVRGIIFLVILHSIGHQVFIAGIRKAHGKRKKDQMEAFR